MTNVAATLDDLRHVAENGKAELVKGELVIMSPDGVCGGRDIAGIRMAFAPGRLRG